MKNATELRNELVDVFQKLKDGTLEHKRAKEMCNAAGKIIGTVSVQLKYAQQRNETPIIEFLNTQEGAQQ